MTLRRPPALRARPLVGRDRELAEVAESIRSAAVTTLIGPGGVGKTALATAIAATADREELADDVAIVWLAPLRTAELVHAEIAAAVGLTKLGGRSFEDALARWLIDKDLLLVFDNCEHVVSAVADVVDALTAQLPRLRILATSREPLWVDGEVCHRLAPLPVSAAHASLDELGASPAVQLFRERAGARQHASLQTDRACRIIGDICRRVDGLPLAIELAAARTTGLDLEDISSHLDDLFTLLSRPARRADGGQRSLRATVEWSDAQLATEERNLLHRMAVFAAGFDLAAINGVCAADGQSAAHVADVTARLVEKSLLMKLGDSGRYHLLETIRQYSIEQLGAAGELDAVRDRHARFYLDAAAPACAAIDEGPARPHIEALGRLEDNVRVALHRLLEIAPEAALGLSAGLTNFWWVQGQLREGICWLEHTLAAVPNAPPELRATGLFCQGFLIAHDTDDWRAAATSIDLGIAALGDPAEPPPILGMLHCLRGECDIFIGDAQSAVTRTQTGLAMMARYPGTWARGFCLWNAAYAKRAAGDPDAAIALLTECLELASRRGLTIGEMVTCNLLGEIWEAAGALETSRGYWERALELRRALGASRMGYVHGSLATSLLAIARVASKQGDLATASKLLRDALPLAEEMRDAATVREIGELLRHASRTEPAHTATLRPESGVWCIEFDGKTAHVPDFKGLWHLRALVGRPGEPVPALSLIATQTDEPVPIGDAGPQVDREALRQYRKRLAILDEALEEAEARSDLARHARCSAERDALLRELARTTGLGGKPRRAGSATEKARLNVTRTLRHAIAYLATAMPELAAHLDESLVTGVTCCYEPRVKVAWKT